MNSQVAKSMKDLMKKKAPLQDDQNMMQENQTEVRNKLILRQL